MERRSVHDQQTPAAPTQPNNTRQGGAARDQQNAATAAELGPPQGPPQLPPQMFTTAAQLLDLTDSMFSFHLRKIWENLNEYLINNYSGQKNLF